jgi:probable phosphoglycerate mutase
VTPAGSAEEARPEGADTAAAAPLPGGRAGAEDKDGGRPGAEDKDGGRAGAEGVLRIFAPTPGATRIVLVRHGEAVCNVTHVVGGVKGDTGLTELGRRQVSALAARLAETGELRGATALYSSVLPRAVETAGLLRPVVGGGDGGGDGAGDGDGDGDDGQLELVQQCDLCELHTGEADGMVWQEVIDTYGVPDWNVDEMAPLAPGGESWAAFVQRSSGAVRALVERHPGELVVAAVHAGVIESTMISFLGITRDIYRRGWLRTLHASMTEWEWVPDDARWILLRFNDACGIPRR